MLSSVLYNKKHIEGFLRYRPETEDAERILFTELNKARGELAHDQQINKEVKRTLKSNLLTNPFDLRGRRHLLTVLEMYEVRMIGIEDYILAHINCSTASIIRNTYQDLLRGSKEG